MKIGLYICDILYNTGGTEAYTARLCQALQGLFGGAEIYFVTECYDKADSLSDEAFVDSVNARFGTEISKANVHARLVSASQSSWLSRLVLRKKLECNSRFFDLFFYCSRGHYIFKAKKNVCIIHFPMERLETIKKSCCLPTRLRLGLKSRKYARQYDIFLPNSEFTQSFLTKIWYDIDSDRKFVLYPPVKEISVFSGQKKNQIFICSRIEKSKNLEVLLDAFKSSDFLRKNYKLVIAGGVPECQKKYSQEIMSRAAGENIEFVLNAPFSKISELYGESKIFWHSKGFSVDEEKTPFLCEHFGISTVEAMSAGCVPVVINKGGQKEIVDDSCGFKWNTVSELVMYTETVAKDETLRERLKDAAIERSRSFNMGSFRGNLEKILRGKGLL